MASDSSTALLNQANTAGKYQDQAPIQVQVDPNAYIEARAKLATWLTPGSETLASMQESIAKEDQKLAQINAAIERSRNVVLSGDTLGGTDKQVAWENPSAPVQMAELKVHDKAGAAGTAAVAEALDIKIKSPTPQIREARAQMTKKPKAKAEKPKHMASVRHNFVVQPRGKQIPIYTASAEPIEMKGATIGGRYFAWVNPNSPGDMAVAASDAMRMNNPQNA
ncbi:MAG TPA: hypothetical protein VHP58_02160 [Alphaproteobacteria bacterium]|nr:hypothetical protein [Alphaproteobacteria bacterium]